MHTVKSITAAPQLKPPEGGGEDSVRAPRRPSEPAPQAPRARGLWVRSARLRARAGGRAGHHGGGRDTGRRRGGGGDDDLARCLVALDAVARILAAGEVLKIGLAVRSVP